MGINCERVIRLSDFQPFEPYLISFENFDQPVKLRTVFFQIKEVWIQSANPTLSHWSQYNTT